MTTLSSTPLRSGSVMEVAVVVAVDVDVEEATMMNAVKHLAALTSTLSQMR
jgi:hypothetical protein